MHKIKASKLLSGNKHIDDLIWDAKDEISIDFSNVENIELKDIKTLLDIQRIAILNKKKFKIENAKPEILRTLEVTGLYKTFSNLMTNPILISKRLSLS